MAAAGATAKLSLATVIAALPPMPMVPGLLAVRARALVAKVVDTPEKVATPATAATAVVPERLPALEVNDNVTLASAPETTALPAASTTLICGCAAQAAPAVAPLGWVEKASREAAPATTANRLEVAVRVLPPASWAAAVSCLLLPARSKLKPAPLKLAVPPLAARDWPPAGLADSTPVPPLSDRVTGALLSLPLATRLP